MPEVSGKLPASISLASDEGSGASFEPEDCHIFK